MHVEKYTKSQCVRMCNHYERTPDDGRKRANENINPALTANNYNLAGTEKTSGYVRMKRILERDDVFVYAGGRANMNTMCDVVLTVPKSLPADRHRAFFENAYQFLVNRYGVDGGRNVVSSWVHMDETTPHMHFSFVPLVEAGEKQKAKGFSYKLCAKAVITRRDLKTLHTDLQKYMDNQLGKGVAQVITGGTEVNKEIHEYKRQKLLDDIAQVEKSLAVLAQDKPKPLEIVHYPAYEKGVLGRAIEKQDSWTIAKKDIKQLVTNTNTLQQIASGLKKLDHLSKILHGDVEKELAQVQEENKKLRERAADAERLYTENRERESAFKTTLEAVAQVNPALAKAVKVATENGRESAPIQLVNDMYNTFRANQRTTQHIRK